MLYSQSLIGFSSKSSSLDESRLNAHFYSVEVHVTGFSVPTFDYFLYTMIHVNKLSTDAERPA